MELITPAKAPAPPESLSDDEALAEALVALRRAAACASLPSHAQRALAATVDLLERYVSKPVLRVHRREEN